MKNEDYCSIVYNLCIHVRCEIKINSKLQKFLFIHTEQSSIGKQTKFDNGKCSTITTRSKRGAKPIRGTCIMTIIMHVLFNRLLLLTVDIFDTEENDSKYNNCVHNYT